MSEPVVIDPNRLYSFAEAATLIPSCQAGKTVSVRTLHNWRKRGELVAEGRRSGRYTYWFVRGVELIRLVGPQPALRVTTPADLKRDYERATKEARKLGLKV